MSVEGAGSHGGRAAAVGRQRLEAGGALWCEKGRGWRLTGGASATVTGGGNLIHFEFKFKMISNQVQIVSNFDRFKKDLSELKFFEIKYGSEGFEESNNFFHWNSSRFKMDFK
jgi:hypothetical protein